jgi:hypothetical protein
MPLDVALSSPPTQDEAEFGGNLYTEFQQARLDRMPLDHAWWVASERYEGNTRVFYDRVSSTQGQVYEVVNRRPRHRNVEPMNLIGPNLDRLIAKQMRVEPIFNVSPTRMDQEVVLAARAARDFVQWIYRARKLRSGRRRLFLNRNITGNGFIKVFHNPSLGAFVDDIRPCPTCQGQGVMPMDPELQPLVDQATAAGVPPETIAALVPPPTTCLTCRGAKQFNFGRKPIGDVDVQIVPPWEIWPLRGSKKIADGCFHANRVPKEKAAADYGIAKEDLQSGRWFTDQTEPQFARLARQRRVVGGSDEDDPNYVWVVEKWLPPLPGSQRPRLTVLVGNRVVFPAPGTPQFKQGWGEVPEPYGAIPIVHFQYRPSVETSFSHGVVKDVISSNDYVNRSRQNTHTHHEKMAAGKWIAAKGALDASVLTRDIGEVVEYEVTMGDAPKQVQPIGMPDWLQRQEQREEDRIGEQMGLTHFDKGLAPPNVEAGYALNFLAEQGDMIGLPILHDDADAWADVMRLSIICAKHWYRPADQRFRRISGKASALEVQHFLSPDIDVENSLDLECVIGTAATTSVALRQQQVMEGFKLGLVSPQEAKRLMEWGALLGENDDDRRLQESAAHAENLKIRQGMQMMQQVPVVDPRTGQPAIDQMTGAPAMQVQPMFQHDFLPSSDDHMVHYMVHRRAAVEAKIEGNLQLAQMLEQAAMQHQMAMQPPPALDGTVDSGSQGQEDKPPA